MNVLTIISYPFLPATTGGEICTLGLHNELAKTQNVTVYTVKPYNSNFTKPNFELMADLPFKSIRYINIGVFFNILKLIKKKQIDLLFFEQVWFGWVLLLLKIFTSKPIYIRAHNIEFARFKSIGKIWWPLLFLYEKYTYKVADKTFFLTENDRQNALTIFKLNPNKTQVIPYGVNIRSMPQKNTSANSTIKQRHKIDEVDKIILFYGTMGYKPNNDAVLFLIEKLDTELKAYPLFNYKILVCGKNLPSDIVEKIRNSHSIIYCGFVHNLNEYIHGADVVVNPIFSGGGIKTKAIDALAQNANLVSTETGAIGIETSVCGTKLHIVKDNDVKGFAEAVINYCTKTTADIPNQFYETYNWEKIIKKIDLD